MVPDKRPPISSSFVSGLPVSCTNRREQAHRRLELGDLLVLILIQLLCICWLAVLINLGNLLVINTDSMPCFGAIAGLHKFDDGSPPYVFGAKE